MKENPNILIVGATGYIGSHLYNYFAKRNPLTAGTTRIDHHSFFHLDLKEPSLDFLDLIETQFDYAIICAAIPNILKCQEDPQETFFQNVLGTLNLMRMLLEKNIKPVLFSSDVVFDGQENLYTDESKPSPINEYGYHKSVLEELAPKVCSESLIIRLSKTFSAKVKDQTLLHELAQRILKDQGIEAASDLIFNPIAIDDVVKAIDLLLQHSKSGLYNITGTTSTSWYELAQKLAIALKKDPTNIKEVSIDQFSPGAKRAKHLNVIPKKFSQEFPNFNFSTIDQNIDHLKSFYLPTSKILT